MPSALSGFLCSPDENGVWRGKARLTNVGTATNTYTVRFSVLRTGSQDVLGMKEESFTVGPGDSTDVAFAEYLHEQFLGSRMRCAGHGGAGGAFGPGRVPGRLLIPQPPGWLPNVTHCG